MTYNLFVFLTLSFFTTTIFAQENTLVPPGSKEIAPKRFQSPHAYKDTVKNMHPRLVARRMTALEEINLPHVRVSSYTSLDPNAQISAVNIYTNLITNITEIFFTSKQQAKN